jgi:hypothetical protein
MSSYSLSFTGSAVRKAESILLARCYREENDWQAVSKAAIDDDLLMIHAVSSRKRVSSELIKRLRNLSQEEIEYLASATPTEQNLLLWIAICRTYQFAEDFSREVIADRFKGLSATITPGVFEGFYDEQSSIHPELRAISEKTHERLRNQFLQMVREVGLADEEGKVQPVFLSPALALLLEKHNQDEYSLFPQMR